MSTGGSAGVLLQLFDFGLHGIQLIIRLLLAILLGLAGKGLALGHRYFVIAFGLGHHGIAGGIGGLLVSLGLRVANTLVGARIGARQLVSRLGIIFRRLVGRLGNILLHFLRRLRLVAGGEAQHRNGSQSQ